MFLAEDSSTTAAVVAPFKEIERFGAVGNAAFQHRFVFNPVFSCRRQQKHIIVISVGNIAIGADQQRCRFHQSIGFDRLDRRLRRNRLEVFDRNFARVRWAHFHPVVFAVSPSHFAVLVLRASQHSGYIHGTAESFDLLKVFRLLGNLVGGRLQRPRMDISGRH